MDYIPDNTPNNSREPYGVNPQGNGYIHQNQPSSPADIYNATAPHGVPNYHYGAPQNFFSPQYLEEQRQKMLQRKHHEKKIKALGTNTGVILLIVLALSFVFSYLLLIPDFSKLYETNLTFASAFGIFYSIVTVGGAFFIGSKLLKKSGFSNTVPYAVPKDKTKTLLLILIGFGGCLLANYITGLLRTFVEGFGIYSTYSALQDPSSTVDVIMIFIGTALIPPLIEEFALRGILMQSMRKYGNLFAIVASAFVFGVFHGNAVQIPFAFLCGLVLGYAVMATESLWTGIIIHALMNAMSGISSALIYYFDEYTSNTFFYIGSAVGITAGIIAVIVYLIRYKDHKILKDNCCFKEASSGEKFLKFITSPVMIFAIILYVIQAATQLTTTPPTY